MLNNLDHDQHNHLPRQRHVQSSAARQVCVRLLQIPARHCPDFSRSVGQLRNEHFMTVEETAFMLENPTTTADVPVEEQLFPLSTRSSNSK
jgi:hypothetical protein